MSSRKKKLKDIQNENEEIVEKVNKQIEGLGKKTQVLYDYLNDIQVAFDRIRNVPSEQKMQYEELKKVRLNWKQQVEKIEKDYNGMVAKNAGAGAAGAGAGVAVAAMGPTAAMGIATTFGVASTGTAISSLSGAAATNAALAWLGGGALAAGGGGMAAGNVFLALFGPVGWTIAGVAVLASGIAMIKGIRDQHKVHDVFILIGERDKKRYNLALVELKERDKRIKNESKLLKEAIDETLSFGTDYEKMTEAQQYALGAYVNLMNSSTQLLVNPIMGLQPLYSERDYEKFLRWKDRKSETLFCRQYRETIIVFSNLLFSIPLDDKDKKLLWKTFKSNKKMLEALNLKKKDFTYSVMEAVYEATEKVSNDKHINYL